MIIFLYIKFNKIISASLIVAADGKNSLIRKKAVHKLEECVEEIEEGEMPLKTYTLIHKEAKLTPEDKKQLINYFKILINEFDLPQD